MRELARRNDDSEPNLDLPNNSHNDNKTKDDNEEKPPQVDEEQLRKKLQNLSM